MRTMRRVVVTGLGLVSPLGNDVTTTWANIQAGHSGIARIVRDDVANLPTQFAGLIQNFDPNIYLDKKEVRRTDPFIHYGVAAAREALRDSNLTINSENAPRIGVCLGSGIGGLNFIAETANTLQQSGARKVSPFFVPGSVVNMLSGYVSILFGLQGPNMATATACATSTHSIGVAARMIAVGDADVMFAGGSEYASCPVGMAAFCAARAMSGRNDSPETASRPWDQDRDGFVLADGAGVLVLESLEHAQARGARIYAELAGFGMSGDAFHITQPSDNGEGAARCMHAALRDADVLPSEIDYVNAHGTSTMLGDLAETSAIRAVFGAHAENGLAVSSTKSMTGHLLGAAGALEAALSVLALRDQILPPTINLHNIDPRCAGLDYVPNVARKAKIHAVLSNSFGFGGTNGTLIFKNI